MLIPSVNFSDPTVVCETLLAGAQAMLAYGGRRGCSHHLPSVGNIVISGDLHDNPLHLVKIVKVATLEVPTNHVVLQELIHSGHGLHGIDMSYRMLVRVAALVIAYPSQVHPILANHELSQATVRPITKGGGELVEMFIRGVEHVFYNRADAVLDAIRQFILAMPIAVRTRTGLMCCHSLPDESQMDGFDTTILDRNLNPPDLQGNSGSAYTMMWGRHHTPKQIEQLAEMWGVRLFCLGHALVPNGIEISMENVLLLNSDHGKGVALQLPLDQIQSASIAIESAVQLASIEIGPGEV